MYRIFAIEFCLFIFLTTQAQVFVQNIRGMVYDRQTQQPLEGVTVLLSFDSEEQVVITDKNGMYVFYDIPASSVSLTFSRIGYESETIENVRLTAGRERILDHKMNPSVELLEHVIVQAYAAKDRPVNQRANVSARSFTIEETTRFAGSYGDPARMAANYAGVLPARDNRNDIIIRGNSSSGLLWRIDGMEVPNPNHFGATGSTGGPITMINSNLLSRSDFFTGAFPAEYSNAVAGVFDLKMRPGNAHRHEHWAQLGWNGLEMGTEGPLPAGKNASYVMAYRYSFVDILSKMGINLPETANYQDISFKVHMPTENAGAFSITGIGGTSRIGLIDSDKPPEQWMFNTNSEDIHNQYQMGALGLNHNIDLSERTRLISSLYATGSFVENRVDTFSLADRDPSLWAHEKSKQMKYAFSSVLRHKINTSTDVSFGGYLDHYNISISDSQYVESQFKVMTAAEEEKLFLYRFFSDIQYRYSMSLSFYLGVNLQYLDLTKEFVPEPRASVSLQLSPHHRIAYGTGLHSQMQPLMAYYVLNGKGKMTNQDLRFTRSFQHMISYDCRMAGDMRLKAEAYYQHLYHIPVSLTDSAYSLANFGAEFYIERKDSLVNRGYGKNYGIEITLEKFFTDGYYLLLTGSLFDSRYTGLDGVWRNTAFNGRYAFNLLAGYEFEALKKGRSFNLGINLTYAGGRPYVPYDIEQSVQQHEVVYDWDMAYQVRREDYKRASFRIGFKRNRNSFGTETAIDLQYRTNYTSVYMDRLDLTSGKIVKTHAMGFYPMATWKIYF